MKNCDLLIIGTGFFSEVMVNDIAAMSEKPLRVVVAGRNVDRMRWLVTSANSRAALYGRPAQFEYDIFDLSSTESIKAALSSYSPKVIVQSASLQSPWKVDGRGSDWAALVNDAGFGFTLALQSMLPVRTARAIQQLGLPSAFVNTCYPDGVNQVIRALGLPITCGVGNIAIFSSVVASRVDPEKRASVRVLAHHNHLVEWRKPAAQRGGKPIRVWLGDQEMTDIAGKYDDIQLPFRDLNLISGASAVPVLLALCGQGSRRAHVPGPGGRPGGYPVEVSEGRVRLDLPAGLSEQEAIDWNLSFEAIDGASVVGDRVQYSSRAREAVKKHAPELTNGFAVKEIDTAYLDLARLRERLGG